jgi:uncharacterized protein (UPF0128 family)
MPWYEKAADDLYKYFQKDYHVREVLKDIKEEEKVNIRFHMSTGMNLRNTLRELGYNDETYGNLDNHYIEILHLTYKKAGL